MASVLLRNITKIFPAATGKAAKPLSVDGTLSEEARPVLNNINLTIADGEFMVLVGPSGCGKSTLLRLISGLETLTNGDIQIGDRTVSHLPPKQRDIAMVFQSYALYPHLSVYDNLAFGLRRAVPSDSSGDEASSDSTRPIKRANPLQSTLVGITRTLPKSLRYESQTERDIAERVRSVAKMLQIEELLTRLPKQLSGGQKQRVALGRAMARNPQVFLMDEPLSNLDAKLRTETRAQIVSLQKQLKTTTIYVTHDQTEAMTMGDRIAVMNEGILQQVAPPLELYRNPANRFVAAFIGSPPMNFLPVTVQLGQLIHSAFTVSLPESWRDVIAPYTGNSLTLGIRPEHIVLSQGEDSFPAIVTQYEALGSETFAKATLSPTATDEIDNPQIQIRLPAEQAIEIGKLLKIALPIDKIHLFEPETGAAIKPE
ncbi:MAG: ATP-binding cassette domain-containing protein [Cyanobacteria bacterium J06576_12]